MTIAWGKGARFFLIAAGVLGVLGAGGCAVALGISSRSSEAYAGLGIGILGLYALIGAAGALFVALVLWIIGLVVAPPKG